MKILKTYLKNYWWKLIIILVFLFADLLTKTLIVRFDEGGNLISFETSLIGNFLVITPATNTGAGFSLFAGKQLLLIISTIIFLLVLIAFDFINKKKSLLYGFATGLILAGAVGNLIDRIAFGFVRDFVYLKFINFPVFNIADISLTVGVALLCLYVIFTTVKEKKQIAQKTDCENFVKNEEENSNIDIKSQTNNCSKSSKKEEKGIDDAKDNS